MADVANDEISPKELKRRLDAGQKPPILDVREHRELAICKLPDSIHIPIGELQERLGELDGYKDSEIIVICKSGGRSIQCVRFMRQHGHKALNLTGGILAWSDDIDPTVPKY